MLGKGEYSDLYDYDHHFIVKSVDKRNQTFKVIHFDGDLDKDIGLKNKVVEATKKFSDYKNLRIVVYDKGEELPTGELFFFVLFLFLFVCFFVMNRCHSVGTPIPVIIVHDK